MSKALLALLSFVGFVGLVWLIQDVTQEFMCLSQVNPLSAMW